MPPSWASAASGWTRPAAGDSSCFLKALSIIVDDETSSRAFSDVIHLARPHQLTAYDAAYLELAIHSACVGVPRREIEDSRAATAGVVLFSPP